MAHRRRRAGVVHNLALSPARNVPSSDLKEKERGQHARVLCSLRSRYSAGQDSISGNESEATRGIITSCHGHFAQEQLFANLFADSVFFLIKSLLFRWRYMTPIQLCIELFLVKDRTILGMQFLRLSRGESTLFALISDSICLVAQTVDHLVATRVIFFPFRFPAASALAT